MFMDAHLGNKRKYKKIFLIRVRIAGGEGSVIGSGRKREREKRRGRKERGERK